MQRPLCNCDEITHLKRVPVVWKRRRVDTARNGAPLPPYKWFQSIGTRS